MKTKLTLSLITILIMGLFTFSMVSLDAKPPGFPQECGTYADVDDGVRDPTNPETSGDGNSAYCDSVNDNLFLAFDDVVLNDILEVNLVHWTETGSNAEVLVLIYDDGVASDADPFSHGCDILPGTSGAWSSCSWETTEVNNPVTAQFMVIKNGRGAMTFAEIFGAYLEVVTSSGTFYFDPIA